MLGVVHATAVVLQAVAHDEVVDMHHEVVAANLAEYSLGDSHVWTLVFDDDSWREVAQVDYGVATAAHSVERDAHFVGHEGRAVAFLPDEVGREMLPHPLLWSQHYITVAQMVPNLQFAIFVFYLGLDRGQVE